MSDLVAALAERVLKKATAAGVKLATAESCTAGRLSTLLADTPGRPLQALLNRALQRRTNFRKIPAASHLRLESNPATSFARHAVPAGFGEWQSLILIALSAA